MRKFIVHQLLSSFFDVSSDVSKEVITTGQRMTEHYREKNFTNLPEKAQDNSTNYEQQRSFNKCHFTTTDKYNISLSGLPYLCFYPQSKQNKSHQCFQWQQMVERLMKEITPNRITSKTSLLSDRTAWNSNDQALFFFHEPAVMVSFRKFVKKNWCFVQLHCVTVHKGHLLKTTQKHSHH